MVRSIRLSFVGLSILGAVVSAQQPARPAPVSQPAQAAQPAQPAQPRETDPNYIVDDEFTRGAYVSGTPGLISPSVTRDVRPSYTPSAMRDKLQGDVGVKVRVGADGRVEDVRVGSSLDRVDGLDQEALRAARQGLYRPAMLNGVPVPSIVDVKMTFRLH